MSVPAEASSQNKFKARSDTEQFEALNFLTVILTNLSVNKFNLFQ